MKTLLWHQVKTWRLAQHCLSPRLERQAFLEVASRTGGLQAQVLSAAELALAARVHALAHEDVQTALWQRHTLIKTWAMRGTLHLLSADELPIFVAARNYHESRNWDGYFAYYGLTPAQQEAFLAAVPEVLGDVPLTREQLASAVGKKTGVAGLRELILSSGWGSPLKPSAFRGDLCFGPSQGQNVTFVNPRMWIGKWQTIDPQQALQAIIRLYLRSYGPATIMDFARWWWGGGGMTIAKKTFQSLAYELEEVEVEGRRVYALRDTLASLQNLAVTNTVHLLPLFDAYTLGLARDIESFLPAAHKSKVFRPQGWISAVVLVNGDIKGVWDYKTQRAQTTITVRPFSSFSAAVKKGIAAEAERFAAFLNTRVRLVYA